MPTLTPAPPPCIRGRALCGAFFIYFQHFTPKVFKNVKFFQPQYVVYMFEINIQNIVVQYLTLPPLYNILYFTAARRNLRQKHNI